jgi:hypothetical protein
MGLFILGGIIDTNYNPDAQIVIFHGDVMHFAKQIPDGSVSLIITSPGHPNYTKLYTFCTVVP